MICADIAPGIRLDSRRAVFFADLRLLVVSDLHWGYAASHRAAGNLLPEWGDEVIARTLDALIADHQPAEMLWLGDSLHTLKGREHAEHYLQRASVPVTILPGNHDARWSAVSAERVLVREPFVFHHGDHGTPPLAPGTTEVVGHYHPAFSWSDGAGGRLKLPALVHGPARLILPAFSPWAAGTPWNQRLQLDEKLWVVSARRVFAVTAPVA